MNWTVPLGFERTARWRSGSPISGLCSSISGTQKLKGLDRPTLERVIARLAWHEWGHALSLDRCSPEDVAAGRGLLELAPEGVRENIRAAQYRPKQYTHEVVAEIYAMLIGRRRRDQVGRPQWLNDEIYELVMRVTGWTP